MYSSYSIFDDILNLRNTVDSFFNEIPMRRSRYNDFPYVNIYEKNDSLTIKAIMPGVEVDDLNIELVDNGLILQGDRKSDIEDKPYIRKERDFGKFKKSIKIPYPVDRNSIKANLKDGILSIELTKSEDAKPKKIEIH